MDIAASGDIADPVKPVSILVSDRLRATVAHRLQIDHPAIGGVLIQRIEQLVIRQGAGLDNNMVEIARCQLRCMHVAERDLDLVVRRLCRDDLVIGLHRHPALIEALHERADLEPHGFHADRRVLGVQCDRSAMFGEMVGGRQSNVAAGLVMHKNVTIQ